MRTEKREGKTDLRHISFVLLFVFDYTLHLLLLILRRRRRLLLLISPPTAFRSLELFICVTTQSNGDC